MVEERVLCPTRIGADDEGEESFVLLRLGEMMERGFSSY